jgi:hypothetical protein
MSPKFFTWVDEKYEEPSQVPERIQLYMRAMWRVGIPEKQIAEAFSIPIEWVEDFVRRDTGETPIH